MPEGNSPNGVGVWPIGDLPSRRVADHGAEWCLLSTERVWDVAQNGSLRSWARARGIVNKGLGVSGSQGEQQRIPPMRT